MPNQNLFDQYRNKDLSELLEALAKTSIETSEGKNRLNFLQSFVSVRTAEMVNRQLAGTAASIGKSANAVKDALTHVADIGKATIENSSQWLVEAIRVDTETTSKSARDIEAQITNLTAALLQASTDLKETGEKSSSAASKLNRFTLVLAAATILMAGAAAFQAYETKRQVDLNERQLQFEQQQHAAPATPANKANK